MYTNAIDGLGSHDFSKLKKNYKNVYKLNNEVKDLSDSIFYFIKNLEDNNVNTSAFYLDLIKRLQKITQVVSSISKSTYKHVDNGHRKLRFSQIKDLFEIRDETSKVLNKIKKLFEDESDFEIDEIIKEKQDILTLIDSKIENQISRTRAEESSPKNTALYFGLLFESRDLTTEVIEMVKIFKKNIS